MITSIEDQHRAARRRVPRVVMDYVDGGSYSETTLRENREALARIAIQQRVLKDVTGRRSDCQLLGEDLSLPLVLAPTGLAGLVHPNGECAAYRAASREGVPFVLSTASINNAADLSEQGERPFWFQIYVMKDRDFTRFLLNNARNAGCRVLVVTVDLVVNAQRHRDVKNGLSVPLRLTARAALDLATKPGWLLRMTRSRRRGFGNFEGYPLAGSDTKSMAAWVADQYNPVLTPDMLGWLRDIWEGPIVVKGVLHPDDAALAASIGMDGIVVSNHGGRQLDGAPSPVEVLPAIRSAVGHRLTVLADSGIRTGADLFRMLALGADACMIGRAFLWGLGEGGEAGVRRTIDILRKELDVTMALSGCTALSDIDATRLVAKQT